MTGTAPVACHCRFATAEPNHDRLVRAPSEVAMALDLVEVAVTWYEIDYSREAMIPPADWLEFAREHAWSEPDVAQRLFQVALDVVRRAPTSTRDIFTTSNQEAP